MNKEELLRERNRNRRKLVEKDRKKTNVVDIHPQNSKAHEKKKFELCWKLEQENKKYICEARFKDRDLRADIYVLDDDELLEIESSEYELQDRKNQYPESKTWVYPLWNEEREVIRLSNHYK